MTAWAISEEALRMPPVRPRPASERRQPRTAKSAAAPATTAVVTVERTLRWCLLLLALALLTVCAFGLQRLIVQAPVAHLVLEGPWIHLYEAQVAAVLRSHKTVSLGQVDLTALQAQLQAMPWVASARVERRWPDTLAVRVVERQPEVRWNDGELIDTDGRRFAPEAHEIPEGLPRLYGPPDSAPEVLQSYRALRRELSGTPFAPLRLERDARGEWTAMTATGFELRFGREAPIHAVPLLLGAVHEGLDGRWESLAYIDLRYSNGFAVGWRAPDARRGGE